MSKSYRDQWLLAAAKTDNFVLRGTPEWDERELWRQVNGCKCVNLGSIPAHQAFGETQARKQRCTITVRTQA